MYLEILYEDRHARTYKFYTEGPFYVKHHTMSTVRKFVAVSGK